MEQSKENMENNIELLDKEDTLEEPGAQEQGEKLFTAEEVNEIVKKRLGRYKKQLDGSDNEAVKALEERSAELDSRERKLECRTYLQENNYSLEILEIIDTSDVEVFKEKADKISGMVKANSRTYEAGLLATNEVEYTESRGLTNAKHKPRRYERLHDEY